jgi:hypothetical protein
MLPHKPKISIVMIDGSFREAFHAVDFFCNQTLPPQDYELIWVEYYANVQADLQSKINKYENARLITLAQSGVYHSSYCFNAGIQAARGELLLIPDADVAVEPDFLENVWNEHLTNQKLVLYIHRYNESEQDHVEPITLTHLRQSCRVINGIGNLGGCITVRKEWLIAINGYDQHPIFSTGLHANGWDVYIRLRNLGLHVMWHPKLKLYHAWHPYTEQNGDQYALQNHVVSYRATKLLTQTFHGINPHQNDEFPVELEQELKNLGRASKESPKRTFSRKWLHPLRQLLHKAKMP